MSEEIKNLSEAETPAAMTDAPAAIEETIMSEIELAPEVRAGINAKAIELKEKFALRKVFAIVVKGEEADEKPLFVAYFRRPGMSQMSQYMTWLSKDSIRANHLLAQNSFIAGDRELIDNEDLFLYGTMGQIMQITDGRNSELVKL